MISLSDQLGVDLTRLMRASMKENNKYWLALDNNVWGRIGDVIHTIGWMNCGRHIRDWFDD